MLDESLKHAVKKTVGLKQTQRALEKGIVKTVYLAQDAEARVIHPIVELCQRQQVGIIHVNSMSELGKACGVEVGTAVAAILVD